MAPSRNAWPPPTDGELPSVLCGVLAIAAQIPRLGGGKVRVRDERLTTLACLSSEHSWQALVLISPGVRHVGDIIRCRSRRISAGHILHHSIGKDRVAWAIGPQFSRWDVRRRQHCHTPGAVGTVEEVNGLIIACACCDRPGPAAKVPQLRDASTRSPRPTRASVRFVRMRDARGFGW